MTFLAQHVLSYWICVINHSTFLRVAFLLHCVHLISSHTKSLIISHELSHYHFLSPISLFPFLSIPPLRFLHWFTSSNHLPGHPTSPPLVPVVPLAVAPSSSAQCPWSTSHLRQDAGIGFPSQEVKLKLQLSKVQDMVPLPLPCSKNKCQSQRCWPFWGGCWAVWGWTLGFLSLEAFFAKRCSLNQRKRQAFKKLCPTNGNLCQSRQAESFSQIGSITVKFSERLSPYSSWKIQTHSYMAARMGISNN